MLYRIKSGYIELEPVNSVDSIIKKLKGIADEPPVGTITGVKDIEKLKFKGDKNLLI